MVGLFDSVGPPTHVPATDAERLARLAAIEAAIKADQALKFDFLVRHLVALPDHAARAHFFVGFAKKQHKDLVERLRQAVWLHFTGGQSAEDPPFAWHSEIDELAEAFDA